ncbi:putative beta-lysine N-acetyltransferase [Heliorestis acidaminivorans]|uniref:Putative beta-lysine N-acetyltransferase n=1 Tax=Heliorestis acidaminivorans TaxID=553427 RepID=A0A6I0EY75_9FIRM|nr:putative beta-lysine N-acetyltransferase [Heliorestis acidaminivorans]KAB2953361.1 putative beta-lysine N-acetyltransferase [Heliorestis acidaminivorans]
MISKKSRLTKECTFDSTSISPQVDQLNRRLIITSIPSPLPPTFASSIIEVAKKEKLEKIWLWAPIRELAPLLEQGFLLEGIIEGEKKEKTMATMAYYIVPQRGISRKTEEEKALLHAIAEKPIKKLDPLPSSYDLRFLQSRDSFAISKLLREVFETYPSPVDNPAYIQELMTKGCLFAGAFYEDKLVSLVAGYPEKEWMRCEITDCATHQDHRGLAFTERLIPLVEKAMLKKGDYRFYTLARATSYGVNRVFYKLGYRYQGRLINNCDIAGSYEDMNLWVKYNINY